MSATPVRLVCARRGDRGRCTLVLHGFTGSARAMEPLLGGLGRTRQVVAPDLAGHGSSPAPSDVESYTAVAQVGQLLRVLREVGAGAGPVDVVGYSMGGRLALTLAAERPDMVRRLALIGATAGLANLSERKLRTSADEELAGRIDRDGIESFVDEWEAVALFATQRALPQTLRAEIRAGRLAQRPHGLANSLRGFGSGVMPPLWDRLSAIEAPTLLLAGELDSKYVALAHKVAAELPSASVVPVAGVGHAAHVEAPDEVRDLIVAHLGD